MGNTALLLAVIQGDFDSLKALLKVPGIDYTSRSAVARTPLQAAVWDDQQSCFDMLVELPGYSAAQLSHALDAAYEKERPEMEKVLQAKLSQAPEEPDPDFSTSIDMDYIFEVIREIGAVKPTY